MRMYVYIIYDLYEYECVYIYNMYVRIIYSFKIIYFPFF